MITQSAEFRQISTTNKANSAHSWQSELRQCITDPTELLSLLNLDVALLDGAKRAAHCFPLKVTRSFVRRMQKGDPNDPLLRQVLPLDAEVQDQPGYIADPTGDIDAMTVPGVLHKYHGRTLLITTPACAINCRYCFRREYPYSDGQAGKDQWQQALEYIANDSSVAEVILSGGDPLMLSDARLGQLIDALGAIPHVRRLRFHTRLPIVLPRRICTEFLQMLLHTRLQCVMVVHCNHAAELDDEVRLALQQIDGTQTMLLNQSVLLRGVNDSVDTLSTLSESLVDARVHPYYLHILDKVRGASHFDVDLEVAKSIHTRLRQQLPGYMVPRLVREDRLSPSKTIV
ncbi:MAG TPA: EF-P beta-lysylation protein EpmB [Chromatiaceae bacterium]|jgi:EF-P beta-lysylation protein EpmB|nr:EF-P beta-lysylation protein EpmB [Chromatiaceae bacterium]HIA09244.1 EF-P beta-lysylation protein EpmB [Chromatiaceae bacterium]HIN82074.1 EF-P beta-lysylation protein EpmB [Chromatiales bacterium]HIO54532.1 EF-P beta-lysylation protein EpmB [Chromatiales bacterium]